METEVLLNLRTGDEWSEVAIAKDLERTKEFYLGPK
jgi:hypothetical protein